MKEHTGRPWKCYGCGTDVVIKGNAPEPINLLGYVCEMGAMICAKCLFSPGDALAGALGRAKAARVHGARPNA